MIGATQTTTNGSGRRRARIAQEPAAPAGAGAGRPNGKEAAQAPLPPRPFGGQDALTAIRSRIMSARTVLNQAIDELSENDEPEHAEQFLRSAVADLHGLERAIGESVARLNRGESQPEIPIFLPFFRRESAAKE